MVSSVSFEKTNDFEILAVYGNVASKIVTFTS